MCARVGYNGVWKFFDGNPVVKGVSFIVGSGEIVCLLGPNGSGKSTLFRMALGIVRPDKGTVLVDGLDVFSNVIEVRRRIGFMPEEPVIYESLKIEEFLDFIFSAYGVKPDKERVMEVLEVLGLVEHLGKLIGDLSHGNKRKAMLASLMLRDPSVLILDEVFSGLDPGIARVVRMWIREMAKRGAGVLVSTHILPIAEAIADRVLIIHRGSIVAEGKPEELKELFGSEELEDVFLEVTGYDRSVEEVVKALYMEDVE